MFKLIIIELFLTFKLYFKEIDNLSVDNEELKAKIYVLERQLILENTVHKAVS